MTATRTRQTPPRTLRLLETSEGRLLCIQVGNNKPDYYRVTALEADFGTAYRLEKLVSGRECYDVNLMPAGRSTCECRGHLRWGTECKHIAALGRLQHLGKL